MNKKEFEEKSGKQVTDKEFSIIEKVYTWHPAISNTEGKEQIAAIYNAGGMAVIKAMEDASDSMIAIDKERNKLKRQLELLKEREERITSGDTSYEKVRTLLEKAFDSSDDGEQFAEQITMVSGLYGQEIVSEVRK